MPVDNGDLGRYSRATITVRLIEAANKKNDNPSKSVRLLIKIYVAEGIRQTRHILALSKPPTNKLNTNAEKSRIELIIMTSVFS